MSERFRPFAATHAWIIQDNKILMLRRFNTDWMNGKWTCPAGHIEADESASQATARETLEEVGITVKPEEFAHAITVHRKNPQSGAIYFDNYFTANNWKGEPYVAEPNKSDAIAWFELDNLPEADIVPTVLHALQQYLQSQHYIEDGWDE